MPDLAPHAPEPKPEPTPIIQYSPILDFVGNVIIFILIPILFALGLGLVFFTLGLVWTAVTTFFTPVGVKEIGLIGGYAFKLGILFGGATKWGVLGAEIGAIIGLIFSMLWSVVKIVFWVSEIFTKK